MMTSERRIILEGRRVDPTFYPVVYGLIGRTVGIAYDPSAPETITVSCQGMEPFQAKPLQIGSYCETGQKLPPAMQEKEPETSRFLDALEKKHAESAKRCADMPRMMCPTYRTRN